MESFVSPLPLTPPWPKSCSRKIMAVVHEETRERGFKV